jgi:hypothetical protein
MSALGCPHAVCPAPKGLGWLPNRLLLLLLGPGGPEGLGLAPNNPPRLGLSTFGAPPPMLAAGLLKLKSRDGAVPLLKLLLLLGLADGMPPPPPPPLPLA